MDILISFIVPIYNCEPYIMNCLKSIASQKTENMEVLVVDDGSTDTSGKICKSFAETDNRFRVIHKANGGASSARNTGIRQAVGEWICFVDGDDEVEENFTEKLSWQAYQDSDVVFFRFSRRSSLGEVKKEFCDGFAGKLPEEASEEWMRILLDADWKRTEERMPDGISLAEPWGKIYRRQFLMEKHISFLEQLKTMKEDVCFNISCCYNHPRLYVENIYQYIYRYVSSSLSRRYFPEVSSQALFADQYIAQIINKDDEAKLKYGELFHLRAIRDFLVVCEIDFFNSQNPHKKIERKRDFFALRNQEIYKEAFNRGNIRLLRLSVRVGAVLCKYKLFGLYEIAWKMANRLGISHG